MKLLDILSSTPATGAVSRRESLAGAAGIAKKLALASLPLGLGTLGTPAQAQSASAVDALNFILTTKLMQQELYRLGLDAAQAPPAGTGTFTGSNPISNNNLRNALQEVKKQEDAQVNTLRSAIMGMGGTPVSHQFAFAPSGSGLNTFNNKDLFLSIAQVIEDTSAKGILGLLRMLQGSPDQLRLALRIQPTDSRHASIWRNARSTSNNPLSTYPGVEAETARLHQSLVNFANSAGVDLLTTIYATENNTQQAGTDITSLPDVIADDAKRIFDEPIPEADARRVLDLFIVQ